MLAAPSILPLSSASAWRASDSTPPHGHRRDNRAEHLAEVRAHFERLEVAKYKWPERVVVLPEMPRVSQVGKIDRRRLREIAETLGAEPR
jgi:acyl-CoA synthetase (AMP-forming)/AMP-acid ligase II